MNDNPMVLNAVDGSRHKNIGASTLADRLVLPAAGFKALDAAVQGLTGVMLVMIPGSVLSGSRNTLVTRDMVTDPRHLFARHIGSVAQRTLADDDHMVLIYGLFLVAVIKLAVAVAVLLRARGANVTAVVVFGALALFELVAAFGPGRTPALVVLAGLDTAVVAIFVAQLVTAARAGSARRG